MGQVGSTLGCHAGGPRFKFRHALTFLSSKYFNEEKSKEQEGRTTTQVIP